MIAQQIKLGGKIYFLDNLSIDAAESIELLGGTQAGPIGYRLSASYVHPNPQTNEQLMSMQPPTIQTTSVSYDGLTIDSCVKGFEKALIGLGAEAIKNA